MHGSNKGEIENIWSVDVWSVFWMLKLKEIKKTIRGPITTITEKSIFVTIGVDHGLSYSILNGTCLFLLYRFSVHLI